MHRVVIWIWKRRKKRKLQTMLQNSSSSRLITKPRACLERIARSEVDGDKGQPNDAGRVHGEADELGLVEVLRNLKEGKHVKTIWIAIEYFAPFLSVEVNQSLRG